VKKPSAKRPASLSPATVAGGSAGIAIRPARPGDLQQIVALDAGITGIGKREYWKGLIERTSRSRQPEGYFLVAEGPIDGGFVTNDMAGKRISRHAHSRQGG